MSLFSHDGLKGRRFLVTGASSGIGRATSLQIASAGGHLILSGRDAERLDRVRSELAGTDHIAAAFEIKELDSTAEWLRGLALTHGTLSGIFHAAGVEFIRPIRLTRNEQIQQVFGSSVFGSFGIARAAAQKGVLDDGASVVFMSSVAASRGQAGMCAYSAAKSAVDGLVRSLACELSPRMIRVNSIAAGAVATQMHERLLNTLGQDGIEDYRRRHLLGFGTAEDVASAALFLLSDAARWITGTTVIVDGGYMAR